MLGNWGCHISAHGTRDSPVDMATGYELDSRGNGVRFPARTRDLVSSPLRSHQPLGTPSFISACSEGPFPRDIATGV